MGLSKEARLNISSGWIEFKYRELKMMLKAINEYKPHPSLAERKRTIIRQIEKEMKYLEDVIYNPIK